MGAVGGEMVNLKKFKMMWETVSDIFEGTIQPYDVAPIEKV